MENKPDPSIAFPLRAIQLASELSTLLDHPLTSDANVATGPIGERWLNMMDRNHAGDTLGRDIALTLLLKLASELRYIAERAPELLEKFQGKLRGDSDVGNYYGTRYEIKIVHDLIRRGEDFRLGPKKGADFIVTNSEGELIIECTSKLIQDMGKAVSAEDLLRKVCGALQEKAAQAGRSESVIICIDITNLGAVTLLNDFTLFDLQRTDTLIGEVLKLGVGALVIHCLKVRVTDQKVVGAGWEYSGIKNPNCALAVAKYLSKMPEENRSGTWSSRIPYMP